MTYLRSNIRDFNFDQLQESVNAALEEGGAIMGTIMEEILDRGREIGEKIGMEKKAREMAKNLLDMGISIDMISKATGLKKEVLGKMTSRTH